MNLAIMNLLLALGWSLVVGQMSLSGLATGWMAGFFALWLTRPLYGPTKYFKRIWLWVRLLTFFLFDLLISGLRVLWKVITPMSIARPGIIAVPLDAETDFEIMLVANLISLTPGTLSLAVSEDRKSLYVHQMMLDDPEEAKKAIKTGIEKRVLEALR